MVRACSAAPTTGSLMDLSRTGFRFARLLGVRVRGVLLGSVGSLMESTKPKELSDPKDVPICHYVRPQETKLPATTIKTLTPNSGSSISQNAQNLSQPSEFSTNDGQDETKQDSNDRPGPNFETKLSSMFCVF